MKQFIVALGWLSFVLFAAMQIPQIYKTLKTKDVEGLSVWTPIIYAVALFSSATYLLLINDQVPWIAVIDQYLCGTLSTFQIYLYFKYKRSNSVILDLDLPRDI